MEYYAIINTQDNTIAKGNYPYEGENIVCVEITEDIYNNIEQYTYKNGKVVKDTKYKQKQQQLELERIQGLSMTRSDFFDGMIKAFGVDGDDLLQILKDVLNTLGLSDIEKKIALNNYNNALNFYRSHTLFTILSGIDIVINDTLTINITSRQWDKFFDETNKGNKEAYKQLQ